MRRKERESHRVPVCPGRDSAQIRACAVCLRLEQEVNKIKIKEQ